MGELLPLPGVARKTANVILGTAFEKNEGMAVDTHVTRLAHRLALSTEDDPVKIERDLCALLPRERWTRVGHQIIWHGRRVCDARAPRCGECPLAAKLCPSAYKVMAPKSAVGARRPGTPKIAPKKPAPKKPAPRKR